MTDLDELEKLEQAATKGPWKAQSLVASYDEEMLVLSNGEIGEPGDEPTVTICSEIVKSTSPQEVQLWGDLQFIAAARNALPALIAELRELRAENAELRRQKSALLADLTKAQKSYHESYAESEQENAKLEKENAELQKMVAMYGVGTGGTREEQLLGGAMELDHENAVLKQENSEMRKQINWRVSEGGGFRRQRGDAWRKLDELNTENARLESEIYSLNCRVAELKRENEELRNRNAQLGEGRTGWPLAVDQFAEIQRLRGAAQVLADAIRDLRSGAGVLSDGQIDRALDLFPEVPHG